MNHFITIFRKEFTDTLRDRRTLFIMVVFPLLLIPLMMTVVTKVQTSSMKKAEEKVLRIGFVGNGNATLLADELSQRKDLQVNERIDPDSAEALISRDELDAVVFL